MSMAWRDLESSVIPSSHSPKVLCTWFLCSTVPLQNVSFRLLGRVLEKAVIIGFKIRVGFEVAQVCISGSHRWERRRVKSSRQADLGSRQTRAAPGPNTPTHTHTPKGI